MENVTCSRCQGEGRQYWEEDGHQEADVCYACAGSGLTDEDVAHQIQLQHCAAILASRYVAQLRTASNEDPDGEGWAFAAAESMMTERDYTLRKEMEAGDRILNDLEVMSAVGQAALIATLLAPEAAAPKAAPEPVAAPCQVPADEDDLPF